MVGTSAGGVEALRQLPSWSYCAYPPGGYSALPAILDLTHLRSVRMHRAHAELVAAGPGTGDTVAARWRFTHAGRFSALHRAMYGEDRSATLRE